MSLEAIATAIKEFGKNISETAVKEIQKSKVENIKSAGDGVLMKLNDIKNLTPEKLNEPAKEIPTQKQIENVKSIGDAVLEKWKDIKDLPLEKLEKSAIIKNKADGLLREREVGEYLEEEYPKEDGYSIESEIYLRDENGNIVKDKETGEARRIDYVVVKGDKVVDSIEVTSKTADKAEQLAKEERIRGQGGNYIKDSNGNLVAIPDEVKTRIERRD